MLEPTTETTADAIAKLAENMPVKMTYGENEYPHVEPGRHSILLLASKINVAELHQQLMDHPELWNEHKQRTEQYAHSGISDIWLRYADESKYGGDLAKMSEEHDPIWYPSFDKLPAARDIIFNTMRFVFGERLGGVLITKVPAGCSVKPHVDMGWHAEYYQKFAVQIAADDDQTFCFDDEALITAPGDLFTFDNQKLHWVENDGKTDRITMIICVRCSIDWLERIEGV